MINMTKYWRDVHFSIVSGTLHGCSNLFFVLPPLLTMFEACSVAVFGWQRVSTAFYGAITRRRLSVRHGWNVSGVNTGCPGSTLVCQVWDNCVTLPASLSSFGQLPAQIRMAGVTEPSSATSFGRVISEPCSKLVYRIRVTSWVLSC